MKNPTYFFLLFLIYAFSACSSIENIDIQKRHYRKGFYFNHKTFSSSEKSVAPLETAPAADRKAVDSFAETHSLLPANDKKEVLPHPVVKLLSPEKKIQPQVKKKKSPIIKSRPAFKKMQEQKAAVPGWLSDTATVFLFALVCLVIPPYWFFFLGFVYVLAKNKKKATFLLITGLVDAVGLALVIAFLIAGSPLLLPVYIITAGIGLVGLAVALIRFFTL